MYQAICTLSPDIVLIQADLYEHFSSEGTHSTEHFSFFLFSFLVLTPSDVVLLPPARRAYGSNLCSTLHVAIVLQ